MKPKILIAIPSKDRVATLEKYTYDWIKFIHGADWYVFIEPQDRIKYGELLHGEDMVVMDKDNQGLGYAKKFIKDYAVRMGYDFVFKIDDDIRGMTNYRTTLKREQCAKFFTSQLDVLMRAFTDFPILKAITFPYRGEMFDRIPWQVTKRIQTCYIMRTSAMHADPDISVFEDFAQGIDILTKGGVIQRYGLMGIDCGVKVGGGTGGHQSFDRKEKALKEAPLLQKIYPPLQFRDVEKSWAIEPDIRSIKIGQD